MNQGSSTGANAENDSSASVESIRPNDLPLSRTRRLELDEFCVAFESAWSKGISLRKSIEEILEMADDELRPYLVKELVAIECEFRTKDGETPTPEDYFERFPTYRDEVSLGFALWQSADENAATAATLPEQIGDFRIVREIGRGGMGVVYEAEQESLSRPVAIKTIIAGRMLPDRARRLEREARTVAKLHHTNIVDVFGTGVHDGVPYFAMEYIDGVSLRDVSSKNKVKINLPVRLPRLRFQSVWTTIEMLLALANISPMHCNTHTTKGFCTAISSRQT